MEKAPDRVKMSTLFGWGRYCCPTPLHGASIWAMKALICSDIHGSADSAERLVALAKDCELVLLLGDELYHGPRNDLPESYCPKKVIPLLNSLAGKIVAVRGNCEAEVDQMVLSFPCMADISEVVLDGHRLTLTHGHIYNEDNLPPGDGALLYGHTHIPVARVVDGRVRFNPGSMSIPKGGWPRSYGVYGDGTLEVRDLLTGEMLMSVGL